MAFKMFKLFIFTLCVLLLVSKSLQSEESDSAGICMEEADSGPCRGNFPRWAFVAMKGICKPFIYGGCQGNSNNFLTQDECTRTCSVLIDPKTEEN